MTTIKVDKERPIKFGVYAFKKYAELEGKKFDEVLSDLDKMSTEEFVKLIYCGFIYGAKKEGQDIDFTEEDVWMWLDETPELMNDLAKALNESMPQGNPATPRKEGK